MRSAGAHGTQEAQLGELMEGWTSVFPAVGHKASSLGRPMKRWDGALSLQHLGSMRHRRPGFQGTPKTCRTLGVNVAARAKEQRATLVLLEG